MDYKKVERQIEEILKVINSVKLPNDSKRQLLKTTTKVKKILQRGTDPNALEDSLQLLMVTVKYLVFDVEATHRQNDYLRKLVRDLKNK